MAFADENTSEAVKNCLRTIIIEAATEASASRNWDDDAELSKNFPWIIEGLNLDYGRGVLHSIHAILIHDTKAFREFYAQRLDEKAEAETEKPELKETMLEIQLRTGSAHRNKFEQAHTQIDYTSYYLGSIFWFIRVAIEAESLLDLQTDTKAYNEAQFRKHIQLLVQIGEGLCEWLPNSSGLLRECSEQTEIREKTSPKPILKKHSESPLDLSVMSAKDLETDDLDALANHLSAAMKNDSMPTQLFNAMADELSLVPEDWRTPEALLVNLRELRKQENQ